MTEQTDFLYPFIDGRGPAGVGALLDDLTISACEKRNQTAVLRTDTLIAQSTALEAAADAMARCFNDGACLYTFGNGGSSTDAASAAELFGRPPHGHAVAARTLAADMAVVTALGNDVGFDLVFSRQLIAHGRPGDIALGISTSGGSRNVLVAMAEARKRSMVTVGIVGYGGGELAGSDAVDHCLVVESDSVHRIQESQAALVCALWELMQARLDLSRA